MITDLTIRNDETEVTLCVSGDVIVTLGEDARGDTVKYDAKNIRVVGKYVDDEIVDWDDTLSDLDEFRAKMALCIAAHARAVLP